MHLSFSAQIDIIGLMRSSSRESAQGVRVCRLHQGSACHDFNEAITLLDLDVAAVNQEAASRMADTLPHVRRQWHRDELQLVRSVLIVLLSWTRSGDGLASWRLWRQCSLLWRCRQQGSCTQRLRISTLASMLRPCRTSSTIGSSSTPSPLPITLTKMCYVKAYRYLLRQSSRFKAFPL